MMGGGQPHKRSNPPEPVMMAKGKGSHIWDVDGNEYIDYLMAFGPVLLGYGYKRGVDNIPGHIHKFMNLTHILANVTGTYGV